MSNETLIIALAVVLVVGALPNWPYSRSWGYAPSGLVTVVAVVLLLWVFMGRSNGRGGDLAGDLRATGRDLTREVRHTGEEAKDSMRDLTR
jgi:hypothetical protein